MKRAILFITASLFLTTLDAQSASDSVKAVVNQLFTAMKNSDVNALKNTFAEHAILQSVSQKGDTTTVDSDSVEEFAKIIGTLKAGAADERFVITTLQVDGPLAIVWGPYKFYFEGKFSHCGADSFQLVRIGGQWKIQYLVDTRRKQPCD